MRRRIETDSLGSIAVPEYAYYGVHTVRARNNFHITGQRLHPLMIESLALIKKAAALTNQEAGLLERRIAGAVISACDEVIAGKLCDQFITDPIQGGAGTSANMNVNEVLANRAIELLGGMKGNYEIVHPNDHVNLSQSTNDVVPSAGHLAAIKLLTQLINQLKRLDAALTEKAVQFDNVIKMGRTQLQDALPIRLGQSFHAYAQAVKRDITRMRKSREELYIINMGGTAIGTSVNARSEYVCNIVKNISKVTGIPFIQANDLIDATQNQDTLVQVSASLKTCAVNLSKMANDFRLMSSGPKTGIAEINLPAQQSGSSIMPGKINPVIPEVVSQIAFNIIGNDLTITMAAEAGQMELNAFLPVLFHNLFESIETLTNGVETLTNNCVRGITANEDRCRSLLEQSVALATALCPYIGYSKATEIAKESLSTNIPIHQLVIQKGLLSESEAKNVLNPLHMTNPVQWENEFCNDNGYERRHG